MQKDLTQDKLDWIFKNGTIQDIDEQFDAVSKCTAGKMYDAEES